MDKTVEFVLFFFLSYVIALAVLNVLVYVAVERELASGIVKALAVIPLFFPFQIGVTAWSLFHLEKALTFRDVTGAGITGAFLTVAVWFPVYKVLGFMRQRR